MWYNTKIAWQNSSQKLRQKLWKSREKQDQPNNSMLQQVHSLKKQINWKN